MKNGWHRKTLGELCEIRNGSTPSKSNPAYWDGGSIPWFTIDDIRTQGRFILTTRKTITQAALEETSVKLLPADSVLLCCTASVGEWAIARIPVTTNQQFNGLVVRDRSELSPDFLFHYAATLKDELLRLSGKTTIDFIPISRVRDVTVPLPPLPEQRRIVGTLDEAFEGIATAKANAEKNLQNARTLFESHLQSVFTQRGNGWVEKRLVEVCVLQRGLDLPTRSRSSGDYPLVSSSGVIDSHNEGPVKGPGVVTGRSGSIGNVFYVVEDFWPLNTVLYVKEFHGNDPKFVYRLLSHFDLKRFATGAGVPTLNRNFVHDERVLIPASTKTQKEIAEKLDALDAETQRLASLYERKLAALETLKKSLLHQAFTGQL